MRASRQETLRVGAIEFRIQHWGHDQAPLLFMLHGWLDCGATFQFLIDELPDAWHVVAPDLRGHGGSHRTHESYPYLQLVADLDALLEHYSPVRPAVLIGHSMGANVASVYAGVRPGRVSHFVNLEGLAPIPGFPKGTPATRIENWLTKLRTPPKNRVYPTCEELAERLRQANPRLPQDRAQFLAQQFSHTRDDGGLEFDVDPYEHASMPMLDHQRLVESTWPRIEAPVLLLTGSESFALQAFAAEPGLFERRLALLRRVKYVNLPGASHNLHHEAPERIADLIEQFLKADHEEITA